MFRTRQWLAVKIICLALFGCVSWLLINECQVESKAMFRKHLEIKDYYHNVNLLIYWAGLAHSKVRE